MEEKKGIKEMIKGKEKMIGAILAIVFSILGGIMGFNSDALKNAVCGIEVQTVAEPPK